MDKTAIQLKSKKLETLKLGAAFLVAFNWFQVWHEISSYKFITENVKVQAFPQYFIFPLKK